MSNKVAWHCPRCGRVEAPKTQEICDKHLCKMQRCSRYEWFLADELKRLLEVMGRKFRIVEQYPIRDHRGFIWYWDIFVWVDGTSAFGGYGELIDVQGASHKRQKRYSGPGGGYGRDYDKRWEILASHRLHKRGIEIRYVSNDDCKKGKQVYITTIEIVDTLIIRADTWC